MTPHRLLITGANGFIGKSLVNEAHAQGIEVTVGVRKGSNYQHPFLPTVELDYASSSALQSTFAKLPAFNSIIHNAGATAARNEAEYTLVNCVYMQNILAALKHLHQLPPKFILMGSLAAYGPLQNTGERRPLSAYGRSKQRANQYLEHQDEIPYLIFNPTCVYGAHDRALLLLLKNLKRGLDLRLHGKAQLISMIYVKDLVKIVIDAIGLPIVRQSFLISDGETYSYEDLITTAKELLSTRALKVRLPGALIASTVEFFAKCSHRTPPIHRDKLAELTAPNWSCDITAAKELLGFIPRYTLREGLTETIAWYRQQGWL